MSTHAHKGLTIRRKILLIVFAFVVLLAGVLYTVSQKVLPVSYESIERAAVLKDLSRVDDSIGSIYTLLNEKLVDWAAWDDTYQFVLDLNQAYKDADLNVSNLLHLNINAIVYADASGKVVFKRAVDLQTEEETMADADEIAAYIEAHPETTAHQDTSSRLSGLLPLSKGAFLFVSQPILTSEEKGPIHGSLIFGKYLNDEVVTSIGTLTHLSVSAYPYKSANSPKDVSDAERAIVASWNTRTLMPLSDSSIAAYEILSDDSGKPILTLKVEVPRDIHKQGDYTSSLLTSIAMGLVVLFGVLLALLLDYVVTSRLMKLAKSVREVGSTGDLARRVDDRSDDEIGELASAINGMLETSATAHAVERSSSETAVATSNELKKRLTELETLNKYMTDREMKLVELEQEVSRLRGKKS